MSSKDSEVQHSHGAESPANIPETLPSSPSPPAFRIPREIFVRIVEFAVYSAELYRDQFKRLLLLTQVCTQWRSAIIDTATFWAQIHDFETPAAIDTIIQRSKDVPLTILTVKSEGSVPLNMDVARKLLAQLHRIKVLTHVIDAKHWPELEALITQHTSALEYLWLAFHSDSAPKRVTLGGERLLASPRLVRNTVLGRQSKPNLKMIGLTSCTVEWSSLSLSRCLTILYLDKVNRPSCVDFVSFLRDLPRLETLDLDCSCPRLEKETLFDHPLDAVCLPNIKVVNLKDEIDMCILFLRTVDCNLSQLCISTDETSNIPGSLNLFWEYTNRRLDRYLETSPLGSLRLSTAFRSDRGTVSFEGHFLATKYVPHEPLCSRALSINLTIDRDISHIQNALHLALVHIPVGKLQVAHVCLDDETVELLSWYRTVLAPKLPCRVKYGMSTTRIFSGVRNRRQASTLSSNTTV